jgi:hypothetical protein
MKPIIQIAIIVIAFFTIRHGINRSEHAECLTWQKQEATYSTVPDFGNPQWAKDQCRQYGILLK